MEINTTHDLPEDRGLPTQSPPAFRASNTSTNTFRRGRAECWLILTKVQLTELLLTEIHTQYTFSVPDT